jgi:hypothetical protein
MNVTTHLSMLVTLEEGGGLFLQNFCAHCKCVIIHKIPIWIKQQRRSDGVPQILACRVRKAAPPPSPNETEKAKLYMLTVLVSS